MYVSGSLGWGLAQYVHFQRVPRAGPKRVKTPDERCVVLRPRKTIGCHLKF